MALDGNSLPISKLYISSQYRADPLGKPGSFVYEIPGTTIETFHDSAIFTSDLHIPACDLEH